ncbi:27112_t:CDS:2, partial [Racocetra persica]
NKEMASTEIHDIDISDVVEDESEQTSNLTGAVIQGLIKELSMPSEPIDDNNRENKSKESNQKLYSSYTIMQTTENIVKKIKSDKSRFNDQQARGLLYSKIATNLLGFTRESLRKKPAKTRNIYKLFGESYDPYTKTIVKGIEIEKIE